MQQDGTDTAIATDGVVANDRFENTLAVNKPAVNKKVPANTSRFTFDLMGSSEELRVLEFLGKESISNPFEFKVILATKNDLLTAAQFMGKSGLLTFVAHEHNELLHGDIARFRQHGQQGDFLLYQVTLVPHFWFLKHRHNHRIFQEQSVPQIIKTIFHEAGISPDHFELRLSREYSPQEYCVQYAESEFDFISRLMEEHGLHYHFEHHLDKHIMVIADHNGAFPSIQNEQPIQYHPLDSLNADKDVIKQFHKNFQVYHGSVHFRDYSFKKPMDRLDDHQSAEFDTALEDYQFPGDYHSKTAVLKSSGGQKTQLKLQQHQALREESELQSNCQRLRAGIRYDMFDNPNGKNNQQYLLTEVQHQAKQPQSLDEYAAGNTGSYSNEAKCIPAKTPYKAPIKHKKPTLTGYQSSTVTGPEGEEIYTNEHAQSKAQFPWDREAQQNEKSSCWIRSIQIWAGRNWGSMILPRMGQEAKTGFIHSDPDRPVITGRVYNERHQTPYALAKHKTRSTFKSHSTLGGRGYNEIRFEDRKNQEQVYFHAEKNLDIRVKNNCRERINHDRHLIVDNNRYEHIKDNSYHTIDNNQNEQIGQVHSISIGQNQHYKAGQAALTEVAQNIHLKAGQKIILEAGVELTIKAGGGFIKIDPSGITAQGASINLNSGTGASSATQASPTQAAIAVAADKDKPGQRFKPIPPQAIKAPEKIGFKGEISRLLQAGNDKKQALCIPCILKSLAKHDVVANVLPNIINTRQKHPLDPLPLEPLPEKELIDIPIGLTYTDKEATPAIEVSYRMVFNNSLIRKGVLDEKGQALERGVPTSGGEIMFAYEETTEQLQDEVNKLYNELEASVKNVAEQTRDAYLINFEKEKLKENKLDPKALKLREELRAVIQEQVDELTAQSKEYDSQSWIERRWKDTKSAGVGLGHGVTDYIPDLGEFGDLMDSMDIDMLDMADIIFNGNQKALKEIEDKLKNSNRLAGGFEQAKESMETLILLLSDEKTREILISLPQKFLEVTPNDQLVEIGVSQATQTGLDAAAVGGSTFVAGVLTAGPGGVAGAAISLTATSARKAGKILEAMMGILKKISTGLKKLKNKNNNKGHPFEQTAKDLKTPLPDVTKKGNSGQGDTSKDDKKKFKCNWKNCKGDHARKINYANNGSTSRGKYTGVWYTPWHSGAGIKSEKITIAHYEAETGKAKSLEEAKSLFGSEQYVTNNHHLIPIAAIEKFSKLSHNAKLIGFDINDGKYGIRLPYFITDIFRHDLQSHKTNHPNYSKKVEKQLRKLEKQCEFLCTNNKQNQLIAHLSGFSDRLKGHLERWDQSWLLRKTALDDRKKSYQQAGTLPP